MASRIKRTAVQRYPGRRAVWFLRPRLWTWALLVATAGRAQVPDPATGPALCAGGACFPSDTRPVFETTALLGVSIDSFAASSLNRYLNPEQSGKLRQRPVAGVAFEYLLNQRARPGRRLWFYGQTIHGGRSADLNCGESVVCAPTGDSAPNPVLAIIRNSASLEAFSGLRWEFAPLNPGSQAPAMLYLKGQTGFLTVAGAGGDLINVHHLALGAIATAGGFAGSYFEAGLGRTDLFAGASAPRLKLDGYLQFPLAGRSVPGSSGALKAFLRMTVDTSPRAGAADSLQQYFGVSMDLRRLF